MKQSINLKAATWLAAGCLAASGIAGAQPACFQSIAAAVQGTGAEDPSGFRLEGVTRNLADAQSWARVRNCAHPGWPAQLVRTQASPSQPRQEAAALHPPAIIIRAGSPVTVLSLSESVRLQVSGVAIEAGTLGQRIRVRVAGASEEHLIAGIVKTVDTLEMVR